MTAKHPTSPGSDILINVDLLNTASTYLAFLDKWSPLYEHSTDETFLRRVIHRYEHYWLPLLADSDNSDTLEPPFDVLWIWQIHILQSTHYVDYCNSLYGRVLSHRLHRPGRDAVLNIQHTAGEWKQRYPDIVDEPYEVDLFSLRDEAAPSDNISRLDFLVEVAQRESEFVYQVQLPHYPDQNFLYAAVDRYKELLSFRQTRPSVKLTLPFDVQLIWRAHRLQPVQYTKDIHRTFGNSLDCVGDTDVGQTLPDDELTREWLELYTRPLFVDGSGYRGRPVDGFIARFPRETFETRTIETCQIGISDVCVEELWREEKNLIVEGRLLGENSFSTAVVFSCKGTIGRPILATPSSGVQHLGMTHFSAKHNRGIELSIYCEKSFGCIPSKRLVSTKQFNPLQYLQSSTSNSQKVVLPKISYTDPKISFTLTLDEVKPNPHVFTMDRNTFESGPMPSGLRHFTESLPTWMLQNGESQSSFHFTRHSLKCREDGIAFGVEIVKQEQKNLAAVLLYHNNQKLVAAAYSIDHHQLPNSSQVLETCTVSYEPGDHAMLIRNYAGHFAVCIARWQQTNNNDDVKLGFTTYFCKSKTTEIFSVNSNEMTSLSVGDVTIELPTGRFTVDASCESMAEHVTWAFTVGTLFVMAQKTMVLNLDTVDLKEGTRGRESVGSQRSSTLFGDSFNKRSKVPHRVQADKRAARQRKKSASFTFLLACGLQIDLTLYGAESPFPKPKLTASSHLDHSYETNAKNDVTDFSHIKLSSSEINGNNHVPQKLPVKHHRYHNSDKQSSTSDTGSSEKNNQNNMIRL